MTILPFQPLLDKPLPEVFGNKDYSVLQAELEQIDVILRDSGVENMVIEHFLRVAGERSSKPLSHKRKLSVQESAVKALRASMLRKLKGRSLREFCCDVAMSPLFQWFIGINRFFGPNVFCKTTLEQWENAIPKSLLDSLNVALLKSASRGDGFMGADNAASMSSVFMDTTCVKANIHHPVDWVLFRDASRTLMLAVACIRKSGIRCRMPCEPHAFISRMNSLCMTMSHSRRRKDSKKARKKTLRKMKTLLKTVAGHAKRHRDKLDSLGESAKNIRPDVKSILSRIDNVLEQLPTVIRQAHERIIGERRVRNSDKILSLYEPDVHVIVRGKSGAEVEFGNTLLLVEQSDGLIVDCRLRRDPSPGDPALLRESLDALSRAFGPGAVESVGGDRGFDSKSTRGLLDELSVFNAVAARSVPALIKQMANPEFVEKRKRRAQTEGRIGIIKNCFLGSPMRQKSFEHREIHVGHGVLAHNLWVLARMILAAKAFLESSA